MAPRDSEPTIAGKTHSEILAMNRMRRWRWYNTISPEKREEAMEIVDIAGRVKMRVSWTPEKRAKMRAAWIGENNPNFGKSPSEETRAKMSAAAIGRVFSEEHKANLSAAHMGKTQTKESNTKRSVTLTGRVISNKTKAKMSAATTEQWRTPEFRDRMSGENSPRFNNWASREPYCHLWDEPLKEKYRNHYGRVCVLSDTLRSVMGSESGLDDFEGHEIFNGRRLSVHHIRGDKMSGCDGTELALIPLQGRFNSEKFDGLKLEDHPFYITLFLLKDIERKHREETLELIQ